MEQDINHRLAALEHTCSVLQTTVAKQRLDQAITANLQTVLLAVLREVRPSIVEEVLEAAENLRRKAAVDGSLDDEQVFKSLVNYLDKGLDLPAND